MDSLRKWDNYDNSNKDSNTTLTTQSSAAITNNTQPSWRQEQAEFRTPRKCLHNFFIVYRAIATVSAATLGFAQFLGMAIEEIPDGASESVRYSLSLYLVAMCVIAVLNELEWFSFIVNSKLLTTWISRGCCYIFMSLLSLDQASTSDSETTDELELIKGLSFIFAVIGFGYLLMGLFCCQIILNKLRAEHEMRCKEGQLKKESLKNECIVSLPGDQSDMNKMELG